MQQYAFFISPKPNRAGLIIHDGKYLMYVRNDLDMVVRDSGCCDWDSADRKLKEFVLDFEMRQEYAMGGENDELFNVVVDHVEDEDGEGAINHSLDGYLREDF